jgi:hypothetical protein
MISLPSCLLLQVVLDGELLGTTPVGIEATFCISDCVPSKA